MRGTDTQSEGVVARIHDGSVARNRKSYYEDGADAEDAEDGARVDLRKYDEYGRPVSRKEAFRLMSQGAREGGGVRVRFDFVYCTGFHGNKSGPMAQERRLRALLKEQKMKEKLTSHATQRDLAKVEQKQRATGSAAIALTMDSAEMEQIHERARAAAQRKLAELKGAGRK